MNRFLFRAVPVLLIGTLAYAQGDECATARAITLGITPYDTTGATTSAPAWPCALGGSDLWFVFTAPSDGDFEFNTCTGGTGYDSALEVFDGTCAALNSIQCNDDSCGLQSRVTATGVSAGTDLYLRVGGFNSGSGAGEVEVLDVTPPPPPPPAPGCFDDRASWNAFAGATTSSEDFEGFVMDTSFEPGPVAIGVGTIEVNSGGVGFRNVIDVFPFVFSDNNGTNHASLYTNFDEPTTVKVTFTNPVFAWGADMTGATSGEVAETAVYGCGGALLAVCAIASNDVDQFNGYAANQLIECIVWRSVNLTPGLGGEGFTGDNFSCVDPAVGPGAACPPGALVPNSTGQVGQIYGTGSTSVAANDLELHCSCLPQNVFGIVVSSSANGTRTIPGAISPICVFGDPGTLGRWPIQNSGDLGVMKQDVDVTAIPIAGVGGAPPFTRALMAGDTWYFQCWHRDVMMNPLANFSDAICITFTP